MNNYYNPVYKSNLGINIIFVDTFGGKINIITTENTKINDLIKIYFYRINRPDLVDNYYNKIKFIYNTINIGLSEYSQKILKDLNLINKTQNQIVVVYLKNVCNNGNRH